jgi:hypothetical protein
MVASIQLQKYSGREPQGAWRQDELNGASRKITLTLTLDYELIEGE